MECSLALVLLFILAVLWVCEQHPERAADERLHSDQPVNFLDQYEELSLFPCGTSWHGPGALISVKLFTSRGRQLLSGFRRGIRYFDGEWREVRNVYERGGMVVVIVVVMGLWRFR